MKNFKNNKNRWCFGVATSVVSMCLTAMTASPSAAQSTEPRVLPPVSVDAPQQRARTTRAVRPRGTPRRSARVAPRRNERPPEPVAPATTLGTTRTIGIPAPAYAGGQVAQGGTLGLLGSTSVMDTPFSTVNYTSQLIEDQQARTAADTLINDASVRTSTGSNGFDDTFVIRGFPVNATDVGLNGLYGLSSSQRIPAQIIERIELLKGPGALINGIAPSGTVGGGINIVTKRATETDFSRLTPFFMSGANYGLHLETSRRFGANKEWGVRFNGVGRNGEASIEDGNFRSGLGALAIDYRGDRLRWTLDAISQNDNTDNFRPQISLLSTLTSIPAAPDARSNWYPGTKLRQKDNTIATGFEYDLTSWLTAYAGVGYRDGTNDQTFPSSAVAVDALGNFTVQNNYYDSYTKTVSGNAGFRSQFDTGFINHKVNVAYTGFYQEAGNAYITGNRAASNIYNPSPLPAITAARTDPQLASESTLTSAAVVDTMSFLNESVLLTLGVRQQNVKVDSFSTSTGAFTSGYDTSATTPLAGIVVKPWRNVSLYANYAEGLTRGTIVGAGYDNVGEVLAPYKSKQQEAGVKVDWGMITTTAAVFQIMRPNSIRTSGGTLGSLAYDGEQRNRGVELNAYGLLLPGLRGMVSATFIKPELTNPSIASQRGNDAAGVPGTTLSASLDWDTPWVRGLSLNGRVIHTGSSYLTTANTVKFPAWTRLDIGARYTTTALTGKPVTFRANIENVTGENYWLTTGTYVTVGAPRTYVLSAAFDF
ncbi:MULTISPECIES: TonB-dependent siderophore receptor [Rhodopseudomonas]|uniref:TonB-dependent receptor n=1 Tax=Rhodopseudomonas palustris TaxID=1076 RepID=A0A0D7EF11_RHOPL|nr:MULTISPECIES: TonB-dependent siderophore receptor [Rhodopseudomonas]KIZ39120.1 TonB-dependent receptor [Rhodopseudomonas palustris]MDF3808985.1 TonB-dependent siderophore receptor [Rhodopseudomonas sp. BAL398]WOK20018.1 TonB-dependent siderophore receptor [Rhodopseudomonas sp. BAL398]